MTGYIKFFDVRKRIGYIVPNGVTREEKDKHVFFHESEMGEGQDARGGEIVEFSLNPNYPNPVYKTRRAALGIRILSKPSQHVPIDQHRKAAANGD